MIDKVLALLIPSDDELAALMTAALITILLWEFVLKRPTRRWQGDASTLYSRLGSGALASGIVVNFSFYGFIEEQTMPLPILALEAFVTTPAAHTLILIYGAVLVAWALKRYAGIDVNLKQVVTGSEKLRVKTIRKADGKLVEVPEDHKTDHAAGDKTIVAPRTVFFGGDIDEMVEKDGAEDTDSPGVADGPADADQADSGGEGEA